MARPPVPEHIESLTAYPPGKPIKELERELGLTGVIKLASNENPFGPSPRAVEAGRQAMAQAHRYPDGSAFYLRQALSDQLGQPAGRFVFGCGTNEVIDLICRVFVGPEGRAVLPHPSFLIYQKFLQAAGARFELTPLDGMNIDLDAMASRAAEGARLVVLCNPNNPTGAALTRDQIRKFVAGLDSWTICLIDEAYIEFVRDDRVGPSLELIDEYPNVVVSRTFSKVYGLAGLRIGYAVMNEGLADYLNRVRQPFNVTAPALAAALAALEDREWLEMVLQRTWEGLDNLVRGLKDLGLEPEPTQTNFILFRSPHPTDQVYRAMLHKGVIIRAMGAFGADNRLRVNVGTEEENDRLLTALAETLKELGGKG